MGSVQSNEKRDTNPSPPPEQQEGTSDSNLCGDSPLKETPNINPSVTTPDASPTSSGDKPIAPLAEVSESEVAEIAAATKSLMEKPGGQSMEIVLSPAIRKTKSRISPPTTPTSITQEALVQKLKDADERRQSIETVKMRNLSSQLAKISIAQQKREDVEKDKAEKIQAAMESKLIAAEENKTKTMKEVKDKVSEHMLKIEKAQKELEASLDAAKLAAEQSLAEKMGKSEELKNLQVEDVLKKIKEHQEHVKKVRNNQEEKLKPYVEELQSNIKAKEERARELKEKKDTEIRMKLAEQNKRAEIVRQNKEKLQQEGDQTNESA